MQPAPEAVGETSNTSTRKAQFFRLVPHYRDGLRPSPSINWPDLLSGACGPQAPAREFCDERKQTFAFDSRHSNTVAIAKRVAGSPVQVVDRDQTIKPLQINEVDAYLAFTTYAYLFPFNAFGIVSGMPGVPRAGAVAAFANHLSPLPDGGTWQAKALTAPAQLEKFHKVKGGVNRLVVKADAIPSHLFTEDRPVRSVYDYMTSLSDAVGCEISIEMTLKVKNAKKHRSGLRRLFELINPEELRPSASKLQVTSDEHELIDLMDHHLAIDFPLPLLDGGVDLDGLVQAFEKVCALMQDEIHQTVTIAEL